MWAAALIALREGLEAALIVGIVLSVLQRLGQSHRRTLVWAGIGAAVAVSILAGLTLNLLGIALQGRGEEIFEGLTMLLAAVVLTWMVFWMRRQGRQAETGLESEVRQAVVGGSSGGLFALAFVAVLREGIETALFLTAATFDTSAWQVWLGTLVGLAVAVGLATLLFAGGRRLNLRLFFLITGVLLLLFAAGLVGRGIHELQEAGLIPTLVNHLWDINGLLNERAALGSFLQALFGYNANPSLLEVLAYVFYLLAITLLTWGMRWADRQRIQDRQKGTAYHG